MWRPVAYSWPRDSILKHGHPQSLIAFLIFLSLFIASHLSQIPSFVQYSVIRLCCDVYAAGHEAKFSPQGLIWIAHDSDMWVNAVPPNRLTT
jgi:hypothetical protein